ncbi:MAG: XRE family transcriptional regulator [Clostridia bacterium]|nr:XRE family transcriptional regulator [Clostridia bacterium]
MKKLAKLCREYIKQGGEPVVSGAFGLRMAEINMSEVQLYLLENMGASFNELLFMLIDRTAQKDSDVYKKARIDRRLFSKIRSSKKYVPCKKTVVALCLALELSREDADALLSSAGYSLSRSEEYDLAIAFCLSRQIFDFDDINEMLYELGFDVF